MQAKWLTPLPATIFWLGAMAQVGAQQLPTIDEAVDISQKTGRPIFALAGSKT